MIKSATIQQKFNHLSYIHDKLINNDTDFKQFFINNDIPLAMSGRVCKQFDHHIFLTDDIICNVGDDQDRLYILVTGEVKLFDSSHRVMIP